ncbi:pogo transposable element with KRAB domain-like protein [Turdus rufiventris]|nr:pogo transposable element with KRAB domain-like protein [Turdus rufiventris]
MDEVPLTFDMPLTQTVEKTGTPMVPVRTTGNEKSSFTVALGVSSDGQKLSPMVIFKRKTFSKDKFPDGIVVAVNPKGWMDEEVMKTWLTTVYARSGERFFNLKVPGLLIFDSMCAHKKDSMKALVKKMNSELAVIPGGLTKELQPLDISVIHSFKVKLHDIESAEADDSEDEDMGDTASRLLDAATAQLMISDTEDEDFEGFKGFT